jgi:protein-tyrosine-phosphatase
MSNLNSKSKLGTTQARELEEEDRKRFDAIADMDKHIDILQVNLTAAEEMLSLVK